MNFDQKNIGDQAGFDAFAEGVAFGLENGLNKEWKIGFGGVYEHLRVDWKYQRGHSDGSNFYATIYTDRESKSSHFSLALLCGYDMFSNKRNIRYTTINETAYSRYHAWEMIGELSAAYKAGPEDQQVSLFATIDSDTLFEPSFKEHGAGGLDLNSKSRISSALISEIGALLKIRWDAAKGGCFGPDVWAAYVNEAFLTDGRITSTFVNQVIPFTVVGVNKMQNLLEVGVSYSWIIKDRLNFSMTYSPQFGSFLTSQRGDIRFRWLF